jgi:RNA polymerase sigma-70 factor (ECF subfamily)
MTESSAEDPVENLERERRKQAVHNAIAALPEHHRKVIVMRDIEEMEYQDMSDVLGCSVGGAKLRVLRARRALKERVAPLLEGSQDE